VLKTTLVQCRFTPSRQIPVDLDEPFVTLHEVISEASFKATASEM